MPRGQSLDILTGHAMKQLRAQFLPSGCLSKTCAGCDSYQNPDLFWTKEGRTNTELNRRHHNGETGKREDPTAPPFSGG